MTFWNLASLPLEVFKPGIRSALESGDRLIMVYMEIGPEMEDTGHAHAFDQCGIILGGQMEMFIENENRLLQQNEVYFVPSGKLHGWKTLKSPVKLLDISQKLDQP